LTAFLADRFAAFLAGARFAAFLAGIRLTIFLADPFAALFTAFLAGVRLRAFLAAFLGAFFPFLAAFLGAFLGAFFALEVGLVDLPALAALVAGAGGFNSGRGTFSFKMSFNIALAANRNPREAAIATGAPV
jgi:hypothetical protein